MAALPPLTRILTVLGVLLVTYILTFIGVFVTRKSDVPIDLKQMTWTSMRPLVIWPSLKPQYRWRDTKTTTQPKFNATTIWYYDTTSSTTTTSTSTTTSTTTTLPDTTTTTTETTTISEEGEKIEVTKGITFSKGGGSGMTIVIGGGMARINYPGMSWKRRHQHPVKAKFRISQKAIEPSDMAEYPDTGYFRMIHFFKDKKDLVICPMPNSNLTEPLINTKGIYAIGKHWLCGGVDPDTKVGSSWCWNKMTGGKVGEPFHDKEAQPWTKVIDLKVPMIGHSLTTNATHLLVHNFDKIYAFNNEDFDIVDLPYSVIYSCLVNLGDNRVAIIGGMNATGTWQQMLIYDTFHKTITYGPSLNIARSNHACYVHTQHPDVKENMRLHNTIVGHTYIGVYGGMRNFRILRTTEFLFSGSSRWEIGPDLFRPMMDATAVYYQWNKGVMLSGGIGHGGAFISVLLDRDQNGTLYWLQHWGVLARTVVSPTGAIYEFKFNDGPHLQKETGPQEPYGVWNCKYSFYVNKNLIGSTQLYHYTRAKEHHKMFTLRPLFYILFKQYSLITCITGMYTFCPDHDWKKQVKKEPQKPSHMNFDSHLPWLDWTMIYLNRLWGKEYLAQNNVTGVTAYMNTVFGQTRSPADKKLKYQQVFYNETSEDAFDRVMSLQIQGDKFFWRGFRLWLLQHSWKKDVLKYFGEN